MNLAYRACDLDELAPGECTVRRSRDEAGVRTWRLWFCVRDEIGPDAGVVVLLSVGLNPGAGPVDAADPEARRWGFVRVAQGTWQVTPSIDVADVWHHTPRVVGAPEPAPWEAP